MLLFRGDDQPQKHHSLQVWQTPFLKEGLGIEQQNNDAYLFKVGNREVVRAMAECHEVLTPMNPLGIRSGGEAGTTPAPGAILNAVVDALKEYGVRDVEMPATPLRVWEAIHRGGAK